MSRSVVRFRHDHSNTTFGLLTYAKESPIPPKGAKKEDGEEEMGDDFVIPEELSAVSDEELSSLYDTAKGNFDTLYNGGQGLTDEAVAALGALTEGIEGIAGELSSRREAALAREAAAQELATRVHKEERTEKITTEDGPEDDEESDDEEERPAAQPAAPAEGGAAPAAPVAVVASSKRPEIRVNMAAMRGSSKTTTLARNAEPSKAADLILASGEGSGYAAGQNVGWQEVGSIVDRRLMSFQPTQYAAAQRAGKHMQQTFSVATITRPIPAELTVHTQDPTHVEEVMKRATDESRLEGGSLVAAGGWCAPSEIMYDLLELESRDGLLSMPEIGISRGGIQWTTGPDWTDIYANTGFAYTEAQDIAGTYAVDGTPLHNGTGGAGSKPCYTVDCPDFVEARLSVAGLCINAGLLQQRGYPEVLARTVRGALIAHDHKMSARKIGAMVAGSTAVTMTTGTVGTTAPLLTAIELQTEHYRYIRRMSRNTTLEAIFPFWVRGAIRSDLALRTGVDPDDSIGVTDADIDGWFRSRGIAPQFVYDWQPLTGAAGTFVQWPTTVQFLLYAAGTWVAGVSDVINIDTLYDSQMLGQNNFTALFTEEGWLVAKRGFDSRVVTVPINSNGGTGAAVPLGPDGSGLVPDSANPTPGTLAGSSITSTGFTLTVTGASDQGGLAALPYRFSTDGGNTWSAYQSSNVRAVTGLTPSTAYQARHQVKDVTGNVATGTAVTVTTTA